MNLLVLLPKDVVETMSKLASEPAESPVTEPSPAPPPPTAWDKAKPYVAGIAGTAVGTLAGAGALHLADQAHQRFKGTPLPLPARAIMPLAGGAAGLLYHLASQRQAEELQRVRENEQLAAQQRPAG